MKHKISIIYSWLIRSLFYFFPNIPIIMRLRGLFYSFLMKECGRNFQVASDVYIGSLSGLIVGDDVYIAPKNVIIALDLMIGDNVIIGPNCVISGGNHQFDGSSFRFLKSKAEMVVICKGAWVAGNCTIVAGASLPKFSILAGGAVLTKRFEGEKGIYGGVPAKFIKNHSK
ncbi:acyltransferase [Aequorivita capsosiphonis]|uniref:acyltransferase n=1 Tax=Aequorivita capsosiphonis TaxID=487317 RepID=UPI000402F177|nr:acyltransferase [Aequorivita capsosiphonis]